MGNLGRRLGRLVDRREDLLRVPHGAEAVELAHWLSRAETQRNHDRDPDEVGVLSLFRLLRLQRRLAASTEAVRSQLLSWNPPPPVGAVDRTLARLAYDKTEPGSESLEPCPPEWRESFEAADELAGLYGAVPSGVIARWIVAAGEGDEGEQESYGITEGLIAKALGPDSSEISGKERRRRLKQALAPVRYSEKGYDVQRHIHKLTTERNDNG